MKISAAIAVLFCMVLLTTLTACSSNGPIAPGSLGVEDLKQDPIIPPINNAIEDDSDLYLQPRLDDADDVADDNDQIIPAGDIGTETTQGLAAALYFLRESGGGVQSIPLNADEFAIHIWDTNNEDNLTGQAIIVCEGGPTSLVDVSGVAMFENGTFPLTVTVLVDGYALATVAETTANVISFALEPTVTPASANLRGVVDCLGSERMYFYTGELVNNYYIESPSPINPDYIQWELEVESGTPFGFSAFLFGGIEIGDEGEGNSPNPASPVFWLINYQSWEHKALEPDENRYYPIEWTGKDGPDGADDGIVRIPAGIWAEKAEIVQNGRMIVVPSAILLENEQYLPIGPHLLLHGDDPMNIEFTVPWFEPALVPDRYIMSGQIVMPDGAIDIVHRDWHPGSDSPDIEFSGIATLGVTGDFGGGVTYPVFAITDPLGTDSELIRLEARAPDVGPVWQITVAGETGVVDTSDYAVPLTWIQQVYADYDIIYRSESIYALSTDIDDYNSDQVIMNRHESCFSAWTELNGI